jgi:threonine aldolase
MLVDLRSDTLTMPSPEMRRAMHDAELGDDVFGEDPTVRRLEERAAALTGKEAGLFVASGTMGNLLALLSLATRGHEVIVEADSHAFLYEGGGAASLGGIQLRPLSSDRGVLDAAQLSAAIRPTGDTHQPLTAAICIENTHNRHGGTCWPLAALAEARTIADRVGIPIHMDGARLFNAAVALGVEATEVAGYADTVSFCVSKGLGAPVGSVLCGPAQVIADARRWRKAVGGGWREAGVLAAAGVYGLEHMRDRLVEDHANARTLAEGLAEMPGVAIDLSRVETNLVIFDLRSMTSEAFLARCSERGLKGGSSVPGRIRFTTRYGIEPAHVQHALAVCSEVLGAG